MANTSIYNAFERLWLHITAAIGAKADRNHASQHSSSGVDPITPEMIGALSGVDTTLSVSNKAADAKAVGDSIAAVNTALNNSIANVNTTINNSIAEVNESITEVNNTIEEVVEDALDGIVYTGDDIETGVEIIDADTLGGINANQYALKTEKLNISGGTMSGDLDMGTNNIVNVANPINDTDALNLQYAKTLFAPAGFGFGKNPIENNITSTTLLNDLFVNCFFIFTGGSSDPIQSSGHTIQYGYGHMEVYADARAKQTITPIVPNYASTLVRYKREGVWDDWEWENPPMSLGVEYRTTERWKGQAVYTKLVEFTGVPDSSAKSVDSGINASVNLIIGGSFMLINSTGLYLRAYTPGTFDYVFIASEGQTNFDIKITTTAGGYSTYTGYFTVKYVRR